MAIIVGFECLVIESAEHLFRVRYQRAKLHESDRDPLGSTSPSGSPKEWFPWAFLSAGGITILYAFTLPKRWYGSPAG